MWVCLQRNHLLRTSHLWAQSRAAYANALRSSKREHVVTVAMVMSTDPALRVGGFNLALIREQEKSRDYTNSKQGLIIFNV